VAIDTPEPSPFSHEILNANPYAYLDDAPLEERRARAVQMRRTLGPENGAAALDPAAIAEVSAQSWPAVRNAEELHDALLTLLVVPPVQGWEAFFCTLRDAGRATVLSTGGANFWVAAERLKSARLLYPDAVLDPRDSGFRSFAFHDAGRSGGGTVARMDGVQRSPDAEWPVAEVCPRGRGDGSRAPANRAEGQILRGRFYRGRRRAGRRD
jgi:ATP-dependent Lhr-like helicase